MYIEKKVELGSNLYYIRYNIEYRNYDIEKQLCFKDWVEPYYDGGDVNILIEKIEKNYTIAKANEYDDIISFMADVIYIYDRLPFICGIKEVYLNKEKIVTATNYISKEEIDKYIKKYHIKLHNDPTRFSFAKEDWYI